MGGDPVSAGVSGKTSVNLNPVLACTLAFVAGVIFQAVIPVLPCGENCKCCEVKIERKNVEPPIKPGPAP